MALQKTHTVNFHGKDVVFQNCYFKVSHLAGSKLGLAVSVDAMPSKDGSTISRTEFRFTPSMGADNFIAQAYNYLKTLPEFAGATDC
jgi:hypothetical protein